MTWVHGIVIVFALAIVAYCGTSASCHDMMPQLATLAGTAIGGVMGNAMVEAKHKIGKRRNNVEAAKGRDAG